MAASHTVRKRLSVRAHAAILRRVAERDRLALLVEALNQSIERAIEQDCRVNLDRQTWTLHLDEGFIERSLQDA